jgi:hypothetical protein
MKPKTEKRTTWFETGSKFETYNIKSNGDVRVMVKKDNKPHHVFRFNQLTGAMKKPNHI